MKLVTFTYDNSQEEGGVLWGGAIYPFRAIHSCLPTTVLGLLEKGEQAWELLRNEFSKIQEGKRDALHYPVDQVQLKAPIPCPPSLRDAYAFRQHVEAARRARNAPMIPEFDMFPVFYFTNHRAVMGPGEVSVMPDHLQKLDFELEVAIVIGKKGRNIPAEKAHEYIFGMCIMNDLSARQLQREEMKLNLGPAKGKDFATVLGPALVTLDELEDRKQPAKPGHTGYVYDLYMRAYVNGEQVSNGNLRDMDWTFEEILERVSYGTWIYPGDIIGSGTVGTGCFLELNGTAKLKDPQAKERWLQPGDEVILEVERLGRLRTVIRVEDTSWSILARKKTPPQST